MEINTQEVEGVTVVELKGDVDANTAPDVQKAVLPLVQPESKLLLNMTAVPYMSSAGLRMLLSTYRQTTAKGGKLVLVGLSDELKDTMTVTGFLDFFTTADTQDDGLAVLQ